MTIGDIYVNKSNNSDIIQIDSFASHMNNLREDSIIIYRNIERHNEYEIGSCPSNNGYGSQEEIKDKYKLLISARKLKNYSGWNEIFDMVEGKKGS